MYPRVCFFTRMTEGMHIDQAVQWLNDNGVISTGWYGRLIHASFRPHAFVVVFLLRRRLTLALWKTWLWPWTVSNLYFDMLNCGLFLIVCVYCFTFRRCWNDDFIAHRHVLWFSSPQSKLKLTFIMYSWFLESCLYIYSHTYVHQTLT